MKLLIIIVLALFLLVSTSYNSYSDDFQDQNWKFQMEYQMWLMDQQFKATMNQIDSMKTHSTETAGQAVLSPADFFNTSPAVTTSGSLIRAWSLFEDSLRYGGKSMQIINPPLVPFKSTATGVRGRLESPGCGFIDQEWVTTNPGFIEKKQTTVTPLLGGQKTVFEVERTPATPLERKMIQNFPLNSYFDPQQTTYKRHEIIKQSYRTEMKSGYIIQNTTVPNLKPESPIGTYYQESPIGTYYRDHILPFQPKTPTYVPTITPVSGNGDSAVGNYYRDHIQNSFTPVYTPPPMPIYTPPPMPMYIPPPMPIRR